MLLYHLHDLHYAVMTPWRLAAEATEAAFRNPCAPVAYTGLGRAIAASAELFERSTRPYDKPTFGLTSTKLQGTTLAVDEEITLTRPFYRLVHFKRSAKNPVLQKRLAQDPKVLIVAPLSGHHATLLRGTVEAMLPDHDVYITDWIDAKLVPLAQGKFDVDDNVAAVVDCVREIGVDTHLLAVCQASVAVLTAVAVMAMSDDPAQPRSMTLIGGPIDPRRAKTALVEMAQAQSIDWFRDNYIQALPFYYPGAYRLVFPGFFQLQNYLTLNADRHIEEQFKQFQNLVRGNDEAAEANQAFYNEFLSVMDVTAEYYLQYLVSVYQKAELANGTFTLHGKRVRPDMIRRTALLTVEAELDDISAPGQTIAAHDLCTGLPASMKRAHLEIGVGHYGVFSGRKWRNNIQPLVANFIRAHAKEIDDEIPAYLPSDELSEAADLLDLT
jgi:poly(3-hydroxybutyrate) depolymerase